MSLGVWVQPHGATKKKDKKKQWSEVRKGSRKNRKGKVISMRSSNLHVIGTKKRIRSVEIILKKMF